MVKWKWKRKQNSEEQTMENLNPKRKQRIKAGLPQKIFSELNELYEFLTIKDAMDMRSYIETDYEELMKVSGLNSSYLAAVIREKLVLKEPAGEGKGYKYRWNTIRPTLDMAVAIIEKEYDRKLIRDERANKATVKSTNNDNVKSTPITKDTSPVSLIDYHIEGDVMTIRLNMKYFNVKGPDIVNKVMSLLVEKENS